MKLIENENININTTKDNLIDKLQFKSETFKYLVAINNCYISSAVYSLQFGSAPESFSVYLKKLDSICVKIEKTKHNREILLEEKVKGVCSDNCNLGKSVWSELSKKDFGKWGNTTDFFGEIKSFYWLENNDFKNIQFIRKQKKLTPDFSAEKGGSHFYIETKCKNMPKDVVDYLRDNRNDGMKGEENYSGLKNIINLIIKNADDQFKSVSAENKILLLSYHWSPANIGGGKTLKEIFGKDYLNTLGKKSNMLR